MVKLLAFQASGKKDAHVHDETLFNLSSLIVAKEVKHSITVFGVELKKYSDNLEIFRNLSHHGIAEVYAALPRDGKIKTKKKGTGASEMSIDLTKEYKTKMFDNRPSTLAAVLKDSNVSIYFPDIPFDDDLKFFSKAHEGLNGSKADLLILVYPPMVDYLPSHFKKIKEDMKVTFELAEKCFKRVIHIQYSGVLDWMLMLNPSLATTKIFYWPFQKKLLPWISKRDLIECVCVVASHPEKITRDTMFLTNSRPISVEYLSEAITEVAGDDVEIVVPSKEETLEMFSSLPIADAATLIYESIMKSKDPVSNDVEMILRRKPSSLGDWVHLNTHFFV